MLIRNFINEFVLLFTAIKDGFMYIFVGLPSSFVALFKKKEKTKDLAESKDINDSVSAGMYGDSFLLMQEKDLKGIISDWIEKTYGNLPWVKEARAKKEAFN